MSYRVVPLMVCVVVVAMLSAGGAAQETAVNETSDIDLGSQLTAFTQSSSAAADDTVENEMWNARFNGTNESRRERIVRNRTGTLTERLTRLRDRNESIQVAYENGSLSRQAYIARQSRLAAEIDSLTDAINDTDGAAEQAGVNDSRLETLKRNASELRGPQVASVARTVGSTTPQGGESSPNGLSEDRTQGPLEKQAGPPIIQPRDSSTERPDPASDRSQGAQANGTPGSERRQNTTASNGTGTPPAASDAPGRSGQPTAGTPDAGQQSDTGPAQSGTGSAQSGSNGGGKQPDEAGGNGNGPASDDATNPGQNGGDSPAENPGQNGGDSPAENPGQSRDTGSRAPDGRESSDSGQGGPSSDTSQTDGQGGDSEPAPRSGQSEPAADAGSQSDTDNSNSGTGDSASDSGPADNSDSGPADERSNSDPGDDNAPNDTGSTGDASSGSDESGGSGGASNGAGGQSQTNGGGSDNGQPGAGGSDNGQPGAGGSDNGQPGAGP